MILPTTSLAGLLLLAFSLVCWGSWANTQKLAGRWRFELFYYDFALGAAICAALAAFTFGSWNSNDLTFQDNLLITGYRNMAYAAGAGIVFNLGNLLLAGAVSVSGMAVAFPVALGIALAATAVLNYFGAPQGSALFYFGGAALAMAAAVLAASAYSCYTRAQRASARKAAAGNPGARPAAGPPRALKGIVLSIFGGIFIGLVYPVLGRATAGENGIGPYGAALFVGAGVLLSTIVYNPFFLNFPIQGKPVEFTAYFKGAKREHLLGWLGGIIWMAGALATFIVMTTRPAVTTDPAAGYVIALGGALASALWGTLAWQEFKGASGSVKGLLAAMYVCFAAGLTMTAMGPAYGR